MKMLKNLFASLLFAVLTFTATAQVTHTIAVNTSLNGTTNTFTATQGDFLVFNSNPNNFGTGTYPAIAVYNTTLVLAQTNTITPSLTVIQTLSFVGLYTYTVTDVSNNKVMGVITVTTSAGTVTGIESLKHTTTKLSVFPNPSTDEVSVTFNTNKEKTTIEVFDIEGRLVMTDEATREIGQNTVKINVSNFSQGIYIVRAGTETFKITKI